MGVVVVEWESEWVRGRVGVVSEWESEWVSGCGAG